jgi:hypothetical protein
MYHIRRHELLRGVRDQEQRKLNLNSENKLARKWRDLKYLINFRPPIVRV